MVFLTQRIQELRQLHFTRADTGWHCVPVLCLLARSSMCLVGIFHALGWMHAMLGMILIFSFCPGHWAFIHGVCVCPCAVCVHVRIVSVHLCALICLPFKLECACVFTCPELISSREHAGFRSICRSGHGAWIDPVAAVQTSDWGSPY